MAITILQQPTYPNATYTSLVYAVESDDINKPQYQYVMDVVSGSNILTRVKQYPNPAGNAIFDPARIMNDYLEYTNDIFASTTTTDFGTSIGTFAINFGESYGSSPSSSVVVYDGNGSVGNPAVTGTSSVVWPATVNPNNGVGWNWDDVYGDNIYLTNYPNSTTTNTENNYKKVAPSDYGLIAFKGSSATTAGVVLYQANNQIVLSTTLSGTTSVNGTYIPSHPKNLLDAGISQNDLDLTAYYEISVAGNSFYYTIDREGCNYPRVNFLFINSFGVWDSHGISLPKAHNTSLDKKQITKPMIDYSSATAPYNGLRRGHEYYNIQTDDRYSVSTELLTQEQAEWMSELLESPSAYIQEGNLFIPILITNSAYTHNTNKKAQKVFQYRIEYTLSNQRLGR